MKRFDSDAIIARLVGRMRTNIDWALLSENGTIQGLLDTFSDGLAENSRYLEYLLAEKKWNAAQNLSSLMTMAPLIAYKAHRPRSSMGVIIVSHTDPQGIARLPNFGRTFFSLDDQSNYDNIAEDPDPQITSRTQALVPWTFPTAYTILKGTRFPASNGFEYIATTNIAVRTLKEAWSTISADPNKLADFTKAGGWSGIKYLEIPVIQGKVQSYTLGNSTGARFESFLLPVSNCEDASNNVSRTFLQYFVNTTNDPAQAVEWFLTDNILLAGTLDNVFEAINTPDLSGVIFKTGDGITGSKLPVGATITVSYLQTAGSAGNLDSKYQITGVIPPNNGTLVDPRTGAVSKFLQASNISTILGGSDADTMDTIRASAPTTYLDSYAIATIGAYESQIKNYAQVGLNKVKVFPGSVANSTSAYSTVYVTAISSDGTALADGQATLVGPVAQAMADLMSPTDVLTYVDPNIIGLSLGVVVSTTSTDVSEANIKSMEKQLLSDNFSIFASDFKKIFRDSEFNFLAKSFPFADDVETLLEALADVKLPNITLTIDNTNTLPTLVNIPFKFDNVYGETPLAQGFQNFKESAPYLFRIELNFLNNPSAAAQFNRTFLVFDQRALYTGGNPSSVTFEEGYTEALSGQKFPVDNANTAWEVPQETGDNYNTRLIRLAQYTQISKVTTSSFVLTRARTFTQSPFEIRPYVVDSLGNKKIFLLADVPPALQAPLPGGAQCYEIDSRYISHVKITFSEIYDTSNPDFASGILTLPLSYFNPPAGIDPTDAAQVAGFLSTIVQVEVAAIPLLKDIAPSNWNDIVAVASGDIKVDVLQIATA